MVEPILLLIFEYQFKTNINMEDLGEIILNSISEEPIYYLIKESESNNWGGIIEAKFNEDCTSKIEAFVLHDTNAEKLVDIEFDNGDDESFACFTIPYITKDGEEEAREYYLEVHPMFK